MVKKDDYLSKIDRIPTVSFNKEQKIIAKKILEKTDEKDLDAVYGLITQRVKTGFVFDEAPEVNHNAVAIVKENKELGIDGDSLDCIEHKLIIGENYDALKNLCATYIDKNGKGLIDVIYIDPPYNTEATKWEGNDYKEELEATKFIYRDKFTRDGWLNMMNERLKLAKQLLSDSGVIFISIDDSEQAYLKVLCDEIFGEENFITNFIWEKTQHFGRQKLNTYNNVDYVLCYSKNKYNNQKLKEILVEKINSDFLDAPLYNASNNKHTLMFKKGTVKFNIKDGVYEHTTSDDYVLENPVIVKNGLNDNDFNLSFKSRWSSSTVEAETEKGTTFWVKTESFAIRAIYADGKQSSVSPKQILFTNKKNPYCAYSRLGNKRVGTNETASNELKEILGAELFSYPKPVSLVYYLISLLFDEENQSFKDNYIILDFFAGSGTTGQAVMELNAEDGGNRQFILVTNNENNIGEKITRERLYRVIKGVGTNGETFDWTYKKDTPYLNKNSVRVFNIETHKLTLNDLDKAEDLKEKAKLEFKKLNQNYSINNDFDIYNELSALNPQKLDKDCK